MATVSISASGTTIDGAELRNAASESSLRELIDAVNGLSTVVGKAGKSGGRGSGGGKVPGGSAPGTANASSSLEEFSDSLDSGTKSTSLLKKTFGMLSQGSRILTGAIDKLGNKAIAGLSGVVASAILVMGDLSGAMTSLMTHLATGDITLSSFTNALAEAANQLPLIGGALSFFISIIGSVVSVLEGYLRTQEQLSANGASFNNDLMLMRSAAASTGLSLEQFGSIVSSNADKLALFGTATEGALKFAKVSNMVRNDLRNLGYSTQELNESLPGIMSIFSTSAKDRGQTDEQAASAVKALMTETDALAKLTGKSRKELADKMAAEQQDAAMKMKMAGMDEKQRVALNMAMTKAREKFGDAGAEMVKLQLLGIAPQTERQRMFAATMGPATEGIRDYVDAVRDGREDLSTEAKLKESLIKQDQVMIDAQEKGIEAVKSMETNFAHAEAGGNSAMASMGDTAKALYNGQIKRDGTLDKAAEEQKAKSARREQEKAGREAATIRSFEETMMQFKKTLFDGVIIPIMTMAFPYLQKFVNFLAEGVKMLTAFINSSGDANSAFGQIISVLKVAGSMILDFSTQMIGPLKEVGTELIKGAKKFIGPLKDIGESLKNSFGTLAAPVMTLGKTLFEGAKSLISPIASVGETILRSGNNLIGPITDVVAHITNGLTKVVEPLSGFSIKIIETINPIIQTLEVGFQDLLIKVTPFIDTVSNTLITTMKKLEPVIDPLEKGVVALLKIGFVFKKIAIDRLETVLEFFNSTIEHINLGPISETLSGLFEDISFIVEYAYEKMSPVFDSIKKMAGVLGDFMGPIVQLVINILDKAIKVAWQPTKTFLIKMIDTAGPIIKWLLDGASWLIEKVLIPFKDFLIGLGAWSIEVILKMVEPVWDAIKNVFSGIFNFATTLWNLISDSINFVVEGWTKIKNGIIDLTKKIGIYDTIKSIVDIVTEFFEGIWNKIKEPFSFLTNKGKNLQSPGGSTAAGGGGTAAPAAGGGGTAAPSGGKASSMMTAGGKAPAGGGGTPETGPVMDPAKAEALKNVSTAKSSDGLVLANMSPEERYRQLSSILSNPIKSTESIAGGGVNEDILKVAASMPANFGKFTGFNDLYHKKLSYKSQHATGTAFDMSLAPQNDLPEFKKWSEQNKGAGWADFLKSADGTAWMASVLDNAAGSTKVNFINEYANPSGAATAGHLHVQMARNVGSIGATGKVFENFGSGTNIQAHDLESIMTPDQLKSIVNETQERLSNEVVDKVSSLINGSPLQTQMVSLLSQMLDALNKSNRINNAIANNI